MAARCAFLLKYRGGVALVPSTMRSYLGPRLAREALLSAVFATAAALAPAQAALGELAIISGASTQNQHPSVDSTGDKIAVAWDGSVGGHRRILLRENVAGEWLDEVIIDGLPAAENTAPVVDIDAAGTVHVAWLGRVNGKLRVFYAFRLAGGTASLWGQVNADELPENSCDAISLRADENGKPWIAWQSGSGNNHVVRVARLEEGEGKFQIDTLGSPVGTYNLFPQVLFNPEPVVVWYSASSADFALIARRFDEETGLWASFSVQNLDAMPENKLPLLMDHANGTLSGLWLDEVEYMDRIFLGRQGVETQGRGEMLDTSGNGQNERLSGAAGAGANVIATWCSDSSTSRSQIFMAYGDDLPLTELVVTDGARAVFSNPKVAATSSGAAVVFESIPMNGDPGRIFFRRVNY